MGEDGALAGAPAALREPLTREDRGARARRRLRSRGHRGVRRGRGGVGANPNRPAERFEQREYRPAGRLSDRERRGTNSPDFGLIGLASFTLPWKLSLDANAGVGGVAQRPGGYLAQGVVSAALSRDIGLRWSSYAEVFFASPAERGAHDSVGFD